MRKSLRGRFRVWDLGTDQYNHADLAYNWDKIDEIVGPANGGDGSPGASNTQGYPQNTESTWLGSKSNIANITTHYPGADYGNSFQQTGARTLYSIAAGLNFNDVPLGTVIAWWRPSAALAVPNGWVICDGSEIKKENHSFPDRTTIRLPDLRNKTILGSTTTQAVTATDGYVVDPNLKAKTQNGAGGAPGLGYDTSVESESLTRSGDNTKRIYTHHHDAGGTLIVPNHKHEIKDHVHKITKHSHYLPPHTHDMWHQHMIPNHVHNGYVLNNDLATTIPDDDNRVAVLQDDTPTSNSLRVPNRHHKHEAYAKEHTSGITRSIPQAYNRPALLQGRTGSFYPYNPASFNFLKFNDANITRYHFTSLPLYLKDYGISEESQRKDMLLSTPDQTILNLFTATGQETSSSNTESFVRNAGDDFDTTDLSIFGENGENVYSSTALSSVDNSSMAYTAEVINNAIITGQTADYVIEINPRTEYVGLLYIMKVKVSTNII